MKRLNFEIGDLKSIAIVFVATAVIIAFGLNILVDIRDDFTTGTYLCDTNATSQCGAEYNATQEGVSAVNTIAGKLGIIATVVVAVVLIVLLVRYFNKV